MYLKVERLTVSFDGWNHLVPLSAWAILWVVRLNRIATFQHAMEPATGLEPATSRLQGEPTTIVIRWHKLGGYKISD